MDGCSRLNENERNICIIVFLIIFERIVGDIPCRLTVGDPTYLIVLHTIWSKNKEERVYLYLSPQLYDLEYVNSQVT